MSLKIFEKKINIKFKNQKLLAQAMVHRSYLNEISDPTIHSNERLEFLGDTILSFIISEWLFEEFPNYPEGTLTNLRSNLVRTSTLAQIARQLHVGNYLQLSKGEKESGGAKNSSILADTFEAIVGAIWLDQGVKTTKKFIKEKFNPLIKKFSEKSELKDAKSLLQEKLQAESKQTPFYKTLREVGPDHDKTFTTGVYAGKKLLAEGVGKSKQEAEEKAAQVALEKIPKV